MWKANIIRFQLCLILCGGPILFVFNFVLFLCILRAVYTVLLIKPTDFFFFKSLLQDVSNGGNFQISIRNSSELFASFSKIAVPDKTEF